MRVWVINLLCPKASYIYTPCIRSLCSIDLRIFPINSQGAVSWAIEPASRPLFQVLPILLGGREKTAKSSEASRLPMKQPYTIRVVCFEWGSNPEALQTTLSISGAESNHCRLLNSGPPTKLIVLLQYIKAFFLASSTQLFVGNHNFNYLGLRGLYRLVSMMSLQSRLLLVNAIST